VDSLNFNELLILIPVRFSASTSSSIVSCEPLIVAGCSDVLPLSNDDQVVALIMDKVELTDVLSGELVISVVTLIIIMLPRLAEVADILPISVVIFSGLMKLIDLSVVFSN